MTQSVWHSCVLPVLRRARGLMSLCSSRLGVHRDIPELAVDCRGNNVMSDSSCLSSFRDPPSVIDCVWTPPPSIASNDLLPVVLEITCEYGFWKHCSKVRTEKRKRRRTFSRRTAHSAPVMKTCGLTCGSHPCQLRDSTTSSAKMHLVGGVLVFDSMARSA